jgi:hypothetical protein
MIMLQLALIAQIERIKRTEGIERIERTERIKLIKLIKLMSSWKTFCPDRHQLILAMGHFFQQKNDLKKNL